MGSFMLAGCSKDEILNHYNNIVQSAGSIELTGKSSLQGEKEKGIDDYTGTYTADYANFSGTEYLFGGTDEADNLTRPFETAALIFRAAVSLRLHKPMMNFLEIL